MRAVNAGTDRKNNLTVAFFCAVAYFCGYLTRKNFSIALVAITEATGIPDTAIAMVPVCLFITYGIGQTVNGAIGDRLSPQYLMTGGLLLSAVCNILIPFCGGVAAMCVVWGINGFAQAMLWPPISKILICSYSGKQYRTATMIVSLSASLSTVAGYLYIPALLSVAEWRTVFFVGSGAVAACAVGWFFYSKNRDLVGGGADLPEAADKKTKKDASFPRPVLITFAVILIDIVAVGMLRDGVETWMPTFVKDSFGFGTEGSILISVIMAIFSCLSIVLTTLVYQKFFKNELTFCVAIFALSTLLAVILLLSDGKSRVMSVASISLISAIMHGSNMALTAYVPRRMKRFGHICTVSGIANSAVYVGAAISTYSAAGIKDNHGWSAAIGVWTAISAVGILLSLLGAFFWNKNVIKTEDNTAT